MKHGLSSKILKKRQMLLFHPLFQRTASWRIRSRGWDDRSALPVIIVSIQKWPICPISLLREEFFPRNINHMPVEKFFARLGLDQIFLFLDENYSISHMPFAPQLFIC
jgi:hypothetical protein